MNLEQFFQKGIHFKIPGAEQRSVRIRTKHKPRQKDYEFEDSLDYRTGCCLHKRKKCIATQFFHKHSPFTTIYEAQCK